MMIPGHIGPNTERYLQQRGAGEPETIRRRKYAEHFGLWVWKIFPGSVATSSYLFRTTYNFEHLLADHIGLNCLRSFNSGRF